MRQTYRPGIGTGQSINSKLPKILTDRKNKRTKLAAIDYKDYNKEIRQ